MKKLLSLTTMAMIALATPTLSAATTANTTKEVKKNKATQNVDYSKMNAAQLEKIVDEMHENDYKSSIQVSNIIYYNYEKPSEAAYKEMLDIYKKLIEKKANLAAEIDKRKEKYDKNHENNKEAYLIYDHLSYKLHSTADAINKGIENYKKHLDKENLKYKY